MYGADYDDQRTEKSINSSFSNASSSSSNPSSKKYPQKVQKPVPVVRPPANMVSASRTPNTDNLDLMLQKADAKIQNDYKKSGHNIVKLIEVNRNSTQRWAFERRWAELKQTSRAVPILCYHGTRRENLQSILKMGLVVPGQGNDVKVVNGSAYGLGIYLAIDPGISFGYSDGVMFLCCALIGNRFVTTDNGSILVITHPQQVLIVSVIEFKYHVPPVVARNLAPVNVTPPKKLNATGLKREKKKQAKQKRIENQKKKLF